ncbi:hypothetical protein [Cerasicoccus arenae]|uniref:Type II secretion system protein GspE N-terminal domain-containing protein n=1 Tax=Cerasicoccus arenae TaxID=424488 RepID=A0A8J3DB05_9BACT|nr:hypothetical protein [Cerasicoccus arenae]MBK1858002.1 hypothetical protein [Cerasicoccus arenae]GHB97535.1 hypothetical protein GCM10007047_11710 [Cerasicoccus arenae]
MLTDKERRPLILRSNRFLGSALLEKSLIKIEDLEAANEKLLEAVQTGNMRAANLLNILLYDLKSIDENGLIEMVTEDESLGMIDLAHYDMAKFREINVDIELCYATYTVPFDRVEDFTMVATAYYLSKPTIQYWEETIGGNIIWYICSVASIAEAIERAAQIAAQPDELATKDGDS